MKDWTKRFALAVLLGFGTFFFALPVSCCGFVFYNQHLYGDVQSGGPEAMLKALGLSAVSAVLIGVVVWRKTGPRPKGRPGSDHSIAPRGRPGHPGSGAL